MTKAHQRIIRDRIAHQGGDTNLFGEWWTSLRLERRFAIVRPISTERARPIILRYEWLGTMPNVCIAAFGLFCDGHLATVEMFTDQKPGRTAYTIKGRRAICLARGASTHWAPPWAASVAISESLRLLDAEKYEFALAYADTDAGEYGTVYQASGWQCVGAVTNTTYWLSPEGRRYDREHHRNRAKRTVGVKRYVVISSEAAEERERMLASGWRIITGGRRWRYATALGSGRRLRERRARLAQFAVPYPKRAGGFNG